MYLIFRPNFTRLSERNQLVCGRVLNTDGDIMHPPILAAMATVARSLVACLSAPVSLKPAMASN